jgi:WD40 repeat protein
MKTTAAAMLALLPCVASAQQSCVRPGFTDSVARVLTAGGRGVSSVAWSADGRWLAAGTLDGTIVLWNTATWKAVTLRVGSEIYSVAFAPSGSELASSDGGNNVVTWDIASRRRKHTYLFRARALAIAYRPNGGLTVAEEAGRLHVINSSGAEVRLIDTGISPWSIAIASDGRTAALGGPLRIFDLETGQRMPAPRGYGLNGVAFNGDHRFLASAEPTGGASIWSLDSMVRTDTLRLIDWKRMPRYGGSDSVGVSMPAVSVAFAPSSDALAVGASDFLVHVWRFADGRAKAPERRLGGHCGTVTSVSYSPAGSLASGSLDGTVRIWR